MDWSASVSRLETSIYLNFSALEELLHTYDDLFGSKQTLVVDKTLGCLCNAITDIMKKSSGTGREKIQKISSLKKIRSRLSDVKRWELDVTSSCCQLSLIVCRKLTAKLSQAFWIWKYQTLEERKNDVVVALEDDDTSDSQDGYSNVPHSSSQCLPPLPDLTSESVKGLSSPESSFHSEINLGDVNVGLTSQRHLPIELSDDDEDRSPDLSVDVSDDSIGVDQDVQFGASESHSQYSSPNTSSYLASYLASPLRLKTNDLCDEEDDSTGRGVEGNQGKDFRLLEDIFEKYEEIGEDQIESQVTLDTLSRTSHPRVDENGVGDRSFSEFINLESISMKPLTVPQSPSDQHLNSYKGRNVEEKGVPPCHQNDSNQSTSAVEIHWNEFSSSDEKSSSNSPSPSEGRNKLSISDQGEGLNELREFGESGDELSTDERSEDIGDDNPKDLSAYSLSDVMDYLSLPLERTPIKSLQSLKPSSTPSPCELEHEDPTPSAQSVPKSDTSHLILSPDTTSTKLQKPTPSRRIVSSTSVLTPRQSIPPPPLLHPLAVVDSPVPPLSSSLDHL